ncbi:hypothetical protein VTI74DRAFT_11262 [Chaetomium olivicolor]
MRPWPPQNAGRAEKAASRARLAGGPVENCASCLSTNPITQHPCEIVRFLARPRRSPFARPRSHSQISLAPLTAFSCLLGYHPHPRPDYAPTAGNGNSEARPCLSSNAIDDMWRKKQASESHQAHLSLQAADNMSLMPAAADHRPSIGPSYHDFSPCVTYKNGLNKRSISARRAMHSAPYRTTVRCHGLLGVFFWASRCHTTHAIG